MAKIQIILHKLTKTAKAALASALDSFNPSFLESLLTVTKLIEKLSVETILNLWRGRSITNGFILNLNLNQIYASHFQKLI